MRQLLLLTSCLTTPVRHCIVYPIMNLDGMTKREAVEIVDLIVKKGERNEQLTVKEAYFLDQISYAVQERFIGEIRQRQKKIPALGTGEYGYLAVWGGEMTPGCRICLEHNFHAIRSVTRCNLRCKFCYYENQHDKEPDLHRDHYNIATNRVLTRRDIKAMIIKAMRGEKKVKGIAWVWFEPFTNVDKHLDLVKFFHDQGIYQHLYTNGTLCTKKNLKAMSRCGLDEIRFNLAATNCSDKVIKNMHIARDHFPYLCIESPMFKEYYDHFVKKRKKILATGVDHIHCAELHLNKNNAPHFVNEDWYQYKNGYVSPMSSRRLTYDLLDMAVEEGWKDIVIHDCSNEVKFYRGVSREIFGKTAYYEEMGLPFIWYKLALLRYC